MQHYILNVAIRSPAWRLGRFHRQSPCWRRSSSPNSTSRPFSASSPNSKNSNIIWRQGEVVHFQRRFNPSGPNGKKSLSRTNILVLATVGGGAAIYYVAHIDRAPVTNRRRMIDMSRKKEHEIGQYAFEQLLRVHKSDIVPAVHPDAMRVSRIGRRIAVAVSQQHPHLVNDFDWKFVLIHKPAEANALCCPGGKVAVFSGLLQVTPDDDALAAVLAHEIAHAVARHSAERISFSKVILAFQLLVNAVIDFSGLTALLSELLLALPYSRKLELEADHIGLEIMAVACYDPAASPKMFQRLADLQAQATGQAKSGIAVSLLSTHPMFSDRIVKINSWLPNAEQSFKNHCRHIDSFGSLYAHDNFFVNRDHASRNAVHRRS